MLPFDYVYMSVCICHAMARRPPFPVNYMSWFPSELQGKAVPSMSHRTQVDYWSEVIEHHPLVTW